MSLKSANKIDVNQYELEVAVDEETFKAAVDKAFKKNVKRMSVPGFRKGHAPRGIIEKMYGEGVFYEDAMNDVYPVAYQEAVKEAGITPVDQAEVEIENVDKTGFTFKAKVTVKPEVEVKDYKGIKVEKNVYTVTDEEVEDEVKRMLERNARVITVEGRAAADGDIVTLDFDGYVDDKAFEGGKAENFDLTLGSHQFIDGFEEQVVGHNVGDEFDIEVKFPEEYHAEELKGKPAVFKIKIHEIKAKELPEADDEFAKDVSEFDTLAELKEDIRKKQQAAKDEKADTELENSLVETLIEGMTAEIPQVMFERRIDQMIQDFDYRLQSQGMNLQTYMQYTGMEDMAAFRKTFAEQAERQVKIRLALEKIKELENLVATQEEIDAELEKMAKQYDMDLEKIKAIVPTEDIAEDLAVNKAIDFVRDNAVITEKKEAKKAAKKPAAKKTTKKAADKAEEPADAEEKAE